MKYESVIGLEVHVQVKTESKLFCGCSTAFGAPPNSQICPVCAGHPGTLPVLNRRAVEALVKTGLALRCAIREESVFARKQYFYPDLPKNYQISQYEKPLAERGELWVHSEGSEGARVGITRIHLEEDAGKLLHALGARELDHSLVDLNRTGVPLMEIVSEPDLRSPPQAQDYLTALKAILQYLEVSDCDMEKGSLRCDANVSIRPAGATRLGTKVEIKNLNSFRGVRDALEYEIERQVAAAESGERIVQETRLWDPDRKQTRPMRSKEEAHDYRYFPEPDLLPLKLSREWIESVRARIPELPAERRKRFAESFGLSDYDARVLTADKPLADYYEKALEAAGKRTRKPVAKVLSNWLTTELLGRLNAESRAIPESPVSPELLGSLAALIAEEKASSKTAKALFEGMWKSGEDPEALMRKLGLEPVSDEAALAGWCEEAIRANAKAAEEFRSGKERAIGALVGAVMKLSQGRAHPGRVQEILKQKLGSKIG